MKIKYSTELSDMLRKERSRRQRAREARKARTIKAIAWFYVCVCLVAVATVLMGKANATPPAESAEPAERLKAICQQHKGYPYVWGGESAREGGFDCSGFVYSVAKKMGKPLPRTTARKYWILLGGARIKTWSAARPGSFIWFTFSKQRPYGHIGILTTPAGPNGSGARLWQSGSSTGPVEVGIWSGSYWDSISVGTKRWLTTPGRDPT